MLLFSMMVLISLQQVGENDTVYKSPQSPELIELMKAKDDLSPKELGGRLSALADAGDASANELLGEAYQFGVLGFDRDIARACDFFERVADERADSAHNLATCYYVGDGRPQDLAKARSLYSRASDNGFSKAHCALGNMLIGGDGGPQDIAKGMALCRLSAEQGVADAQTDLGGYLLTGEVVEKDVVEARQWLTKAAEQNQANASFLLGQIYWYGDGTEKDVATAMRWWKVAHAGGRPDAAFWLMRASSLAIPVKSDRGRAINREAIPETTKWALLAAKSDPSEERRAEATQMLALIEKFSASQATD